MKNQVNSEGGPNQVRTTLNSLANRYRMREIAVKEID